MDLGYFVQLRHHKTIILIILSGIIVTSVKSLSREDKYTYARTFNDIKIYGQEVDGMELPFLVSDTSYFVFSVTTKSKGVTLWFSITPCNNHIEEWYVRPITASPRTNTYIKIYGENQQRRHNRRVLLDSMVDVIDGDTGSNITDQIVGQLDSIPSYSLEFVIKAPPGTLALFYASYRYAINQPFHGFPRMRRYSLLNNFTTCRTETDKLRVTFLTPLSLEMDSMEYCVAINEERPLPNHCSAQMFINLTDSSEKVPIFIEKFSPKKIEGSLYKCAKKTIFEFQDLELSSTYYINLYAINRLKGLAASYPAATWDHSAYLFRKCYKRFKKIDLHNQKEDIFIPIRPSVELYINVTALSKQRWYAWFQPCKFPPEGSDYKVILKWNPYEFSPSVSEENGYSETEENVTFAGNKSRENDCVRFFRQYEGNVCAGKHDSSLVNSSVYKLTIETENFVEPNSVIGQLVLSHKGIHFRLFPFSGMHSFINPNNPVIPWDHFDLRFDCLTNQLLATVYAHKLQEYCFYIIEAYDRKPDLDKLRKSILKKVNLCHPQALQYTDEKCIATDDFIGYKQITANFTLHNSTGYTILVHHHLKSDLTYDHQHAFPFFSLNYISVTAEQEKCKTTNHSLSS